MNKKNLSRKNQKALVRLIVLLVIAAIGYFGTHHFTQNSADSGQAGSSKVLSSSVVQKPLPFKNQRQLVMAQQDSLGRAVNSHIQLKNSQEPRVKREPLTFNPVGWHNYNFYFKKDNGQTGRAWLMSRGHLVGYQFCGLNNEPRNLVPETVWFNGGNYVGMNDRNEASMLYYENRLDRWLAQHPSDYLDYQVTPLYQGNELVPRQIRLAYVGIDPQGNYLAIKLGGGREKSGKSHATVVVLDNVSPNAKINYATGTAENTVKRAY